MSDSMSPKHLEFEDLKGHREYLLVLSDLRSEKQNCYDGEVRLSRCP
jgi:hypothetical protein